MNCSKLVSYSLIDIARTIQWVASCGGGHVGLYVGETDTAYRVLGGNQSNMVNETWIAKNRLAKGGMRWPHGTKLPPIKPVYLKSNGEPLSRNEA